MTLIHVTGASIKLTKKKVTALQGFINEENTHGDVNTALFIFVKYSWW